MINFIFMKIQIYKFIFLTEINVNKWPGWINCLQMRIKAYLVFCLYLWQEVPHGNIISLSRLHGSVILWGRHAWLHPSFHPNPAPRKPPFNQGDVRGWKTPEHPVPAELEGGGHSLKLFWYVRKILPRAPISDEQELEIVPLNTDLGGKLTLKKEYTEKIAPKNTGPWLHG